MRFLLDTDMCIYIIKRKPPEVLERFREQSTSDIGVSSITIAELEYGVYKSQNINFSRISGLQLENWVVQ
jgi:tRNA(fMet)-specific endonuclease VapC